MSVAQLEARMILNADQYQRAAAQVQRVAAQIQQRTELVQQSTNRYSRSVSQAASQLGLFYGEGGRLVDAMGNLVPAASAAAQAIHKLEEQAAHAQIRSDKFHAQLKKVGGYLKAGLGAGVKAAELAIKGITAALAGATAAATGFFAHTMHEATHAQEILQNANRLNIDTTSYQVFDYAATRFGISADKAADILKDVNDKLGDYISTGGGEAKDVFDKLGLSAEQFIGLAPDKAILKIGEAMEGLSTQDKTFLLESLADDASLLLPLLDENGKKLKELKQEALERGAIISSDELFLLDSVKNTFGEITGRISAFASHVAAYMSGPLKVVLDEVNKIVDGFGGMDAAALKFSEAAVNGLITLVKWCADIYGWFLKWEIKLIDLKAYFISMGQGLAKTAELFLKYTPAGWAADGAAKAISGKSLSDRLLETQKDMDSRLSELANERAKAEQSIAKANAAAQKFANTIGQKMLESIQQSRVEMMKNQVNGYATYQPNNDRQRSLDEYQKSQNDKAQKELDKLTEKQKELTEKIKEALMKPADKQDAAGQKMQDAADKNMAYVSQLTALMQQNQQAIQQLQAKLTPASDSQLTKSAPPQSQAPARSSPEDWARAAEIMRQNNRTPAQREADAAQQKADITAMAQQIAQQNSKQFTTAQENLQRAAMSMDNLARSNQALVQQQAYQVPIAPQVAPKPVEIKVSGDVTVRLDGSNDSVSRTVVGSNAFKEEFKKLFKLNFNDALRETARAVS